LIVKLAVSYLAGIQTFQRDISFVLPSVCAESLLASFQISARHSHSPSYLIFHRSWTLQLKEITWFCQWNSVWEQCAGTISRCRHTEPSLAVSELQYDYRYFQICTQSEKQ
jgi:hypothetical protein